MVGLLGRDGGSIRFVTGEGALVADADIDGNETDAFCAGPEVSLLSERLGMFGGGFCAAAFGVVCSSATGCCSEAFSFIRRTGVADAARFISAEAVVVVSGCLSRLSRLSRVPGRECAVVPSSARPRCRPERWLIAPPTSLLRATAHGGNHVGGRTNT